jgi:hypothetical protein
MANNPITSLFGNGVENTSFNDNRINDIKDRLITARVVDISLNTNSPLWDQTGQWGGIGTIQFQLMDVPSSISSINQDNILNFAKPLLPYLKNYPLVNEIVLLFQLPNTQESQTSTKKSYYYLNSIGLWNHPHHNAYPNMYSSNNGQSSASNRKDYQQIETGNVRRTTTSASILDLNGESGGTFIEQQNIHPILPFAGDNILEGRFGNSIRLGNTAKSTGAITNNWSYSGENGNPVTILRNGQPISSSSEGWIPITENINEDLASIYLTSNQQIPINVAVENKEEAQASTIPFSNTIKQIPISPKAYNAPQVILNSGRLLFNTTSDSILFSSKKSIVLESIDDLAIKSQLKNINILAPAGIVSLGKQNASESIVLGDKFMLQFENLISSLENLCLALSKEPKIPNAGSVATLTGPILKDIKNLIPSFKSNTVKTS